MMLKAEAISASYGRVKVLKDIDMSVAVSYTHLTLPTSYSV